MGVLALDGVLGGDQLLSASRVWPHGPSVQPRSHPSRRHRQVGSGSFVLRIACLDGKVTLFPIWISELPIGVGEEYRNRRGMAVHDRLLVRAVVHFQNSHLI